MEFVRERDAKRVGTEISIGILQLLMLIESQDSAMVAALDGDLGKEATCMLERWFCSVQEGVR